MDKIAANNHLVQMRKEIKKAKAMVSGNLIRKMAKLKKEKERTEDEKHVSKIDDKIERIFSETRLIKSLDADQISKRVTLKPDAKYWNDVIDNSKSTDEERLQARIISKNNIWKQVSKFREENKECDEWLEEYFEYREKKKDIVGSRMKSTV